ncbi:hypothetical protein FHG87_015724, partial [Trinorchestia longiramus]
LQFYESECTMRVHSCNVQVDLHLRPVEDCADAQKDRPCNGTAPLVNPTTGEELQCGEGGTICPYGTFCHRAAHFAKCCRDFSVSIS